MEGKRKFGGDGGGWDSVGRMKRGRVGLGKAKLQFTKGIFMT